MPEYLTVPQRPRSTGLRTGSARLDSAPLQLGTGELAGLSPATRFHSVLRALIILPLLVAGIALVLVILVPALFVVAVLLLIGLSPFLLAGLGILLAESIESPSEPRTAKTDCLCGGKR